MKKTSLLILASLALPILAFAQTGNLTVFETMATSVGRIVNLLIPIVFGLGIVAFFWGLVQYLFGADHDKDKAKKTMLWGVVAIFIMAAIWGLVAFIGSTFGISTDVTGPVRQNINLPVAR